MRQRPGKRTNTPDKANITILSQTRERGVGLAAKPDKRSEEL
jgi:hypothetical protein